MIVNKIIHESQLIAIILRENESHEGIQFYTSDDSAQQLGAMSWSKGHVIKPHVHRIVERVVLRTQEVLVVQKGKVRLDLYDDKKVYLESHIVEAGDIIFLSSGGHGFTMLEDSVMIEIKQGPYIGELDKMRFDPITESELNIKA